MLEVKGNKLKSMICAESKFWHTTEVLFRFIDWVLELSQNSLLHGLFPQHGRGTVLISYHCLDKIHSLQQAKCSLQSQYCRESTLILPQVVSEFLSNTSHHIYENGMLSTDFKQNKHNWHKQSKSRHRLTDKWLTLFCVLTDWTGEILIMFRGVLTVDGFKWGSLNVQGRLHGRTGLTERWRAG